MNKLPALFLAATLAAVSLADTQPSTWRPRARWRGFNLMGMFVKNSGMSPGHFPEEEFRLISELGFNFVRLPLDYRFWIMDDDWEKIDEQALKPLDEAIACGRKHGLHVLLNFHRAPGYTVAKPSEVLNVFQNEEALRICVLHWGMIARRYKEIPVEDLSFNLFNEPIATPDEHEKVVVALLTEIRKYNPGRLVICDGIEWGKTGTSRESVGNLRSSFVLNADDDEAGGLSVTK